MLLNSDFFHISRHTKTMFHSFFIFFLIFSLPVIQIGSLIIPSVPFTESAFAQIPQSTVYRGDTYQDIDYNNGTHKWTGGLVPYIFDGNSYQPFIFTDLGLKQVETGHGSVQLGNDGIYNFYQHGVINSTELFTDRIVAKYADVSNLNSWTYLTTLNNDSPDISWNGNDLVSSKLQSGVGQLDYKYILNDGKWKTQLEATNLSALNTKAFGFDQIIDLNSDTISFGGVTRNLDNFDGVTFNKQFLTDNQGKVLDFLNGVNFDFDLGFENLYSVTVYDTGVNSSQLVFD